MHGDLYHRDDNTISARGVGHASQTRDRNNNKVDFNAPKPGYMYTATKQQPVVTKVTQNSPTLELVAVSLTNLKSQAQEVILRAQRQILTFPNILIQQIYLCNNKNIQFSG